jgi:hypothetical protein
MAETTCRLTPSRQGQAPTQRPPRHLQALAHSQMTFSAYSTDREKGPCDLGRVEAVGQNRCQFSRTACSPSSGSRSCLGRLGGTGAPLRVPAGAASRGG